MAGFDERDLQAIFDSQPDGKQIPDPSGLSINTGADEETSNNYDAFVEFSFIPPETEEDYDFEIEYRKSPEDKLIRHHIKSPSSDHTRPIKTGTGTVTMQATGNYFGDTQINVVVKIDGAGAQDTFKYSIDGGSSFVETLIPTDTNFMDLLFAPGISIKFSNITGAVLDDQWTFSVFTRSPIFYRIGKVECLQSITWAVRTISKTLPQRAGNWVEGPEIQSWAPDPPVLDMTLSPALVFGGIRLIWIEPLLNPIIIGWNVYRGLTSTFADSTLIHSRAKSPDVYNSWTDDTVIPDQTYYYFIEARDRFGRVSSNQLTSGAFKFLAQAPPLNYNQIEDDDIPPGDGMFGYVQDSVKVLTLCDDASTWVASGTSVYGAYSIVKDTINLKEGTGSIKITLPTKPVMKSYEDFSYQERFLAKNDQPNWYGFRIKTPATGGTIKVKYLSFYLKKHGGTTNDVTARLRNDSAGVPGSEIANAVVSGITTTAGWRTATLAVEQTLNNDTWYWVTVEAADFAFNTLHYYGIYSGLNGQPANYLSYYGEDSSDLHQLLIDKPAFKVQGNTDALNAVFYDGTLPGTPVDLTQKANITTWFRCSRTGNTFSSYWRNNSPAGDNYNAVTIAIANSWESNVLDISGVTDDNKDSVNRYGVKVTNVDADSVINIDYSRSGSGFSNFKGRVDGVVKTFLMSPGYGAMRSQIFTSNGTFIVPSNVSIVWITAIAPGGGGAGGGGSGALVGNDGGGGGGGGSGQHVFKFPVMVVPSGSITVTVPAGGALGAGGAANVRGTDGTDGGDVLFSYLTVKGGKGGAGGGMGTTDNGYGGAGGNGGDLFGAPGLGGAQVATNVNGLPGAFPVAGFYAVSHGGSGGGSGAGEKTTAPNGIGGSGGPHLIAGGGAGGAAGATTSTGGGGGGGGASLVSGGGPGGASNAAAPGGQVNYGAGGGGGGGADSPSQPGGNGAQGGGGILIVEWGS